MGRTISQEWKRLIPLADIAPIRRALLDFYLTLIDSPVFLQTRLGFLRTCTLSTADITLTT